MPLLSFFRFLSRGKDDRAKLLAPERSSVSAGPEPGAPTQLDPYVEKFMEEVKKAADNFNFDTMMDHIKSASDASKDPKDPVYFKFQGKLQTIMDEINASDNDKYVVSLVARKFVDLYSELAEAKGSGFADFRGARVKGIATADIKIYPYEEPLKAALVAKFTTEIAPGVKTFDKEKFNQYIGGGLSQTVKPPSPV